MRNSRILNLLIVEDSLDDEQLLCEALLEIEENRLWCNWRSADIVPVDCLSAAQDCLRRERFDAILLNLSLPDSPALLDSFVEIVALSRGVPILVLADEPDESLATTLVREGVQDVLVKAELECAPLARAIRYAIERQRRMVASRASAFSDELTSVLSRDAFQSAATYYAHLPLQLSAALIDLPSDREALDPLLIQTAEVLALNFQAPSLVGRWDRSRFCVLAAGLSDSTVESMLNRVLPGSLLFSVTALDAADDVEEVFSRELHLRAKTAILAD